MALVFVGVSIWATLFTDHAYITSPSMYPTIPPGSLVFIEKQATYHIGDVIEFRGSGLSYLHRVVAISSQGNLTTQGDIITKGDNPQSSPDVFIPPTTTAVVMGKVVLAPRWLGFPELIAHHPSYGLAWLRAELGLAGKLVVLAALTLGALLFLRRRPTMTRSSVTADPTTSASAEARVFHETPPHMLFDSEVHKGTEGDRAVSMSVAADGATSDVDPRSDPAAGDEWSLDLSAIAHSR